jgi:hypothetical protein
LHSLSPSLSLCPLLLESVLPLTFLNLPHFLPPYLPLLSLFLPPPLSSIQIGGTLLSAPSSLAITTGLSGSALEIAANSMLPSCACDIERSLDILCNALEAVTADTHIRYNTHTEKERKRERDAGLEMCEWCC